MFILHILELATYTLQLQTKFLDNISDGISLVTGDVSQCNLHVQLPRILLVPGHHECPRHLLTLHQGELIVQVEHGLRPVGGDTPGYSTVQYSTVQHSTAQYSTTVQYSKHSKQYNTVTHLGDVENCTTR